MSNKYILNYPIIEKWLAFIKEIVKKVAEIDNNYIFNLSPSEYKNICMFRK